MLQLLREFCSNNKVQLAEHFANADTHHRKKVTRTQFVKLLVDAFGNFKVLEHEQIEQLAAAYSDPEDALNVHYWAFLAALRLTNQPYNPLELTATVRRNLSQTGSGDVHSALRKIAQCAVEQAARPKQFFEDYDRLRKGVVHPSKFVTALDNLKV